MMMTIRSGVCQRALQCVAVVALIGFSLTACSSYLNSSLNDGEDNPNSRTWVQNGMVTISRAAPPASGKASERAMLGFVPATLNGTPTGSWLSIDKETHDINLMKNDQVVSKLKGEGLDKLEAGLYKVKHKQRNPLWYAPDTYFQERNQQPPAEGDKARFRRGALGEFVVFIDQDTPIHSGPLWLQEIGGIKMDEADLSKIYYSLEVGSTIEVK